MITQWIVSFGTLQFVFYTHYHADQFVRALTLNGTACNVTVRNDGAARKMATGGFIQIGETL